MRTSLAPAQWDSVAEGVLRGPAGATFTRRSSRIKRREADALIAAGTPLVLYDYGGGRLDWCDGDDARGAWDEVRGALVSDTPRPRGTMLWTGGVWATPANDVVLILTGHC